MVSGYARCVRLWREGECGFRVGMRQEVRASARQECGVRMWIPHQSQRVTPHAVSQEFQLTSVSVNTHCPTAEPTQFSFLVAQAMCNLHI
jgi:hypothetical protein